MSAKFELQPIRRFDLSFVAWGVFTKEPTATRGGKARSRPIEATPDIVGRTAPSSMRRRLASTRGLFCCCWAFGVAAMVLTIAAAQTDMVLTIAAAQTDNGEVVASLAEALPATDEVGGSRSVLRQGAAKEVSAWSIRQRHLQAFESSDHCMDSPLWKNEVDSAKYIFGCKEIEDMLHGSKMLVGKGLVRDVYVAAYMNTIVVLKVLQEQEDPSKRKAALHLHKKEALVLNELRGHPNIVQMLGVCNTTLVSEYYATTLDSAMGKTRDRFSIEKIVSMALDAARALQALHEASIAPIVHFDIKPQQLLLGEDGRLMLNDFNMPQFMGARGSGVSCPLKMKGRCRAVVWRSPENIAGKPLTEKVDIYSMGMIFFSLISGRLPFPHGEKGSVMIRNGERPAIDHSWHSGLMQVVQGMWQQEPAHRPSARQVVARLEAILESLTS